MTGHPHPPISDVARQDADPHANVAWWWRAIAPMAFPLVLWWVGCFFFLGDIGKSLDDYGFHRRDAATGVYEVAKLFSSPLPDFWRPLYMIVSGGLITLAWNEFWAAHLACALVHLLNTLFFFRVLRLLSVRRTVGSVCSVLFLTSPIGYEAIFWPSTFATPVALLIFLALVLPISLRFARLPEHENGGVGWGWLWAVMLFPLMFTIGCLYEQMLTMAACLPPLYFVVARHGSMRKRVLRMSGAAALAVGGGLLYTAMLMLTAIEGRRGAPATLTPWNELVDKVALVWRQGGEHMTMRDFLPGAVRTGWSTIGAHWSVGITVVIALILSASAWLNWRWRLIRMEQAGDGAESTGAWRMWLVAAGGVAIFFCAWLPVVVVRNQWVAPRLSYVPTLGAVMVLAAVLETAARMLAGRALVQRAVMMVIGTMAIPPCLTGMLTLVGVQYSYRERYRMDQEQLALLKDLIPAPLPDTVFMPVKLEDWPVTPPTGSVRFDRFARGVWEMPWSAIYGVWLTYRDKQVYGLPLNRWRPPQSAQVTDEAFLYSGSSFLWNHEKLADGRTAVPWSSVVVFTVDRSKQLRLAESLVIKREGSERRVELPLVKAAREREPERVELFVRDLVLELGP